MGRNRFMVNRINYSVGRLYVDHKMDVVRDTYFEENHNFKINLNNLEALFRRQSIHAKISTKLNINYLTSVKLASS